jgi:intein/homing endonuclease
MHSCFAKGTPVWTKTGLRQIETLALGDLVLAQDVNTGELKYVPVIGRTVRPPSQILKITTDGEKILATKGHPFWVTGVGWRMAKELADGAMLHGINKSSGIRSVEPAGETEAYNLVVADFNTYFVGEHGFLVHDNTPRRPTRALVPGVVKN